MKEEEKSLGRRVPLNANLNRMLYWLTSMVPRQMEAKMHCFNCKTHGFRTFSHFGPHIWNNLPNDIRHAATLQCCLTEIFWEEIFWVCFTPISLFSVCVCVCVCIVTLEPLSTLCVNFFFPFFLSDNIFHLDEHCVLSLFLIGRMFLHEPSWKYSAKLVGS